MLVSVNIINCDGQVLVNKVCFILVVVSIVCEISLVFVNKLIDDIVKVNVG